MSNVNILLLQKSFHCNLIIYILARLKVLHFSFVRQKNMGVTLIHYPMRQTLNILNSSMFEIHRRLVNDIIKLKIQFVTEYKNLQWNYGFYRLSLEYQYEIILFPKNNAKVCTGYIKSLSQYDIMKIIIMVRRRGSCQKCSYAIN